MSSLCLVAGWWQLRQLAEWALTQYCLQSHCRVAHPSLNFPLGSISLDYFIDMGNLICCIVLFTIKANCKKPTVPTQLGQVHEKKSQV
jgi:hypothetical protein